MGGATSPASAPSGRYRATSCSRWSTRCCRWSTRCCRSSAR
ncbi:hypothetical protein FRUB_04327 [Fimbriiglobus ruber]|uniref:Uncharacterized protein n=1 Tax=Fimbriiglobus ruber TaxID=1908690 RepID=A0A225D7Q4_9BACT|nr:hypothetical protein FRUB_10549 [Fimbriiglobus ruber]OWK35731.1 hypothetical protein FRUB_08294 [Fimbriiglobus ruber]OWK37306.1 hypothetical protein FRUB_06426 [Fimbriiglobus ruber]OWK37754.1 hypothetical protein FRUB_06874 [Fimbriiglobus ruber]OWK37792.1 hypothetical protein FRUB_06912 [Fimbriiglobus ruber]